MRLGGPVRASRENDAESWVAAVRAAGYRAAYCPVTTEADATCVAEFRAAAERADILIAEVGAWSNPLSRDPAIREAAKAKCRACLDLAERIGAGCCVNIVGSLGEKWDGPCPEDLTTEAFDAVVESIRGIVDDVKPKRSFYTLETMPWMYPDSADSYLALLKAIDRPQVAVHLDPVNLINSPGRCFRNGELLRECFEKLGPLIKSCHAKDIRLQNHLTVHLDEVRPGLGTLDYGLYLRELSKLSPDVPLMLEHLPNETEYHLAAEHIRSVARREGVQL